MSQSILIVDDHAGFRAQARRLLESEGYQVIGEAEDVGSALDAVRALEPEVALVDVHLPEHDGCVLAERLLALPRPPMVVLISSHDGFELSRCAAECGALGFVPKSELSRAAIEELVR